MPPLDRLPEDLPDRVRDLVDARGRAPGHVEDLAVRARGLARADRRVDDVAHVGEVTRLLAVAVDLDRPTGLDRGDEARNDRGVLRERALTWPEDVEVAQNDRLERLVDAREAHAVALGGELRDRAWRGRGRRRRPRR